MSRRLPSLLLATALLALGGCASSQANTPKEPSAQAQGGAGQQSMCAMCPMGVQGTQVAASDVEGGVALTFTTTTGNVEDLRARVAKMAEHHNAMASGQKGACDKEGQACMGHDGMHGGGMGMGKGMGMGMPMMGAKASVEEVPGGSRLVLKTDDPAQVAPLREHAHQHAEMMAKGGCGCAGKQAAQTPGAQGT